MQTLKDLKTDTYSFSVDHFLCILQQEEVDAKAEELIPANIRQQLASTNWKERLAGTEALTQVKCANKVPNGNNVVD